jgi:hypothetical protein
VEDHPELVKGYIAAKIRPVQSGFFYCAGAGKCDPHYDPHHRNVTAALFAVENSDVLMAEALGKKIQQHADGSIFGLGSGDPAEHCLETEEESTESKSDDAISSSVVERIFGFNVNNKDDDDMGVMTSLQNLLWRESSDSDTENDDYNPGGHSKHNCVSCYKKSVKRYMKRVVGRVMRFCEHSKCPFVQKVCKWAEEHKEFSLGYLLGATKPFAFSAGYCIGEGECHRFHDTDRSEMLHDLFGMEPEVRQPRMGQLVFTSVESLVNEWL